MADGRLPKQEQRVSRVYPLPGCRPRLPSTAFCPCFLPSARLPSAPAFYRLPSAACLLLLPPAVCSCRLPSPYRATLARQAIIEAALHFPAP